MRPLPSDNARAVVDTPRVADRYVLPLRPRFLRELVIIPLEHGLLVDGTADLRILKGRATRGSLQRLIELMDGTRTLRELGTALRDVPDEDVHSAVSALFGWGLIEDATRACELDLGHNPETLGFFRRHIGATRANRSGAEAYQKLEAAQVVIFGEESGSKEIEILESLLQRTGTRSVTTSDRQSFNQWTTGAQKLNSRSFIVSFCMTGEDCDWHEELDDWCAKHQISWLRVVVSKKENWADLGPVFNRAEGPCYRCFRDMHGKSPEARFSPTRARDLADCGFWAGMAAVEIIYLLTHLGPVFTEKGVQRYDLEQTSARYLLNARVPGCGYCRPLPKTMADYSSREKVMDTALVFEDYVARRTFDFTLPKAMDQLHKNTAPIDQEKQLPSCRQHALNRRVPCASLAVLDVLQSSEMGLDRPIMIDELGATLLMTAGIRESRLADETVQRWAPTAGNLGSVELFLAVRDVDGLQPGFYFYQPHTHSLAFFQRRAGAIDVKHFIDRIVRAEPSVIPQDLPDVLVLFTGAFARLASKYGPFAYRLLSLDAGVAVSQMELFAKGLNIHVQVVRRWPDDLIEEQLNLEKIDEQSTAVVALYRRAAASSLQSIDMASPELRSGLPPSAKNVREFFEMSLDEIVEVLYSESRLKESELDLTAFATPSVFLPDKRDDSLSVPLPPPATGGRFVIDVLRQRISVRSFTDDAVSVEQLGTMLHLADLCDLDHWPEECRSGNRLTFLALARHVQGINKGVYSYDLQNHRIDFLCAMPGDQEAVQLYVQSEFAYAPLAVWITGNLALACARHGSFGHRQLLLRAGAAAQRLSLVGAAMGLAGTIVAGLIPNAARRSVELDGYSGASLVAYVAGHESTPK